MTSYVYNLWDLSPRKRAPMDITIFAHAHIMPQPRIFMFAAPGSLDQTQIQHWKEEGFAVDFTEISGQRQLENALKAVALEETKYGIIGTEIILHAQDTRLRLRAR